MHVVIMLENARASRQSDAGRRIYDDRAVAAKSVRMLERR